MVPRKSCYRVPVHIREESVMAYTGSAEERARKQREANHRFRARHPDRMREHNQQYARRYPDRIRRKSNAYHARNRQKQQGWNRQYYLRKHYGISLEEYEALLQLGNGKCWLCGTDQPGQGRRNFCVDHDHSTGAVRGLLCNTCNMNIIGQMEERGVTPALLTRYLSGKKKCQSCQLP